MNYGTVNARELSKVDVSRVSLVENGANGREFEIFKSAKQNDRTPRERFVKSVAKVRKDFNAEYERNLNCVWELFLMMHNAVFNDAGDIEEKTDTPVTNKELLEIITRNYEQFLSKAEEAIAAHEAEEEKAKQKALLESSPRTIGEIIKATVDAVFNRKKENKADEVSDEEEGQMASEEATAIVEAIGDMGTKVTEAVTMLNETMTTRFDTLETLITGSENTEGDEGEVQASTSDTEQIDESEKSATSTSDLSVVLDAVKGVNAQLNEIAAKNVALEKRLDAVAKARGLSHAAVTNENQTQTKRASWGAYLLGATK